MEREQFSKIAYKTLQQGKSIAGLAHKEISARIMNLLVQEKEISTFNLDINFLSKDILDILKSIFLYLLFSAIFFMKTTAVFAASGAAVNYINTVYALMLCESGSTLSSCSNPLIIRSTPSGTNMNIGGVSAGESAGSYGNLNVLKAGTTYTYGQVVLDRSFTISGTGKDDVGGDDCQTNASRDAGTSTAFAVGKEGTGTGENQ